MAVPSIILELCDRFRRNLDSYRSPSYNETQLRREFVDPFFKSLGWDMDNEQGHAEAYKDVVHEDSIKIGGSTKAPDYSFRIGGTRKFFVEAKKPAVNIAQDVSPAFQLRRYAWSAKLPLSILTDFEEFAVYDCRVCPEKNDKASTARTLYLNFEEYAERWDDIASIFSRDAILKGSFDKYAESTKKKRGTAEVDSVFLQEIEQWRTDLARNLATRNPDLSQNELNFAVQKTIDRIIFLRICEDRGVETYGQLQTLLNGQEVFARLCEMFRRADDRYNSGLFHFSEEKGRAGSPDAWTLSLAVDDRVLKEMVRKLYYPESPYEFSVLSADILGQVYEQFLGKVIRLTKGHQAKVEDKPEVKKAGGVYYTPTYIVKYIVEQTVGKLLEGKDPYEVAARTKTWKQAKGARPLAVLDPACGSGSFLIGAYQYLLDWYRDWYIEHDPAKYKDRIYQTRKDQWLLTTAERKRILLDHIYGVDIDSQAVEVTKLSLLLKVLEGENRETLDRQLRLFHERALPDLANNIKCGNSLIGPDFYETQQLDLFDDDERLRINVFDWQSEFPEIMNSGGFDAVIGNPPYIQLSMAAYFNQSVSSYLETNYTSSMGRLNTFGLFIEQVLKSLLSFDGYLSFIVPNTLLTQEYYQTLRRQILDYSVVILATYEYPVFKGAVVETTVFVIQGIKATPNHCVKVIHHDNRKMSSTSHGIKQSVYQKTFSNAFLVKVDAEMMLLRSRLDAKGIPLKQIANINQAIALKYDRSASLFKVSQADNYKRVLDGRHIQRYALQWGGDFLAYNVNKIHSCKRTDIFETAEKIFFRRVGDRLIATSDDQQFYALNTLVVITLRDCDSVSLKYILGLLNSTLLNFYYITYLKSTKKVFSEIQARQLAQLPIYKIDFSNSFDGVKYKRMITLVEQMLDLNKKVLIVKTPHQRTVLERQIAATDREIDAVVYELYGLSDKEIRIVEEATAW